MSRIGEYEISKNIKRLEYNGDTTYLEDVIEMVSKARDDKQSYFEAFSAMVEMEEAANSIHISAYDLSCLQMVPF